MLNSGHVRRFASETFDRQISGVLVSRGYGEVNRFDVTNRNSLGSVTSFAQTENSSQLRFAPCGVGGTMFPISHQPGMQRGSEAKKQT